MIFKDLPQAEQDRIVELFVTYQTWKPTHDYDAVDWDHWNEIVRKAARDVLEGKRNEPDGEGG